MKSIIQIKRRIELQNKIYSMLGLCMKAGKLAYGTDMCLEKIKFGKAKLVIVAEDASKNTKDNFRKICSEKKTTIFSGLFII